MSNPNNKLGLLFDQLSKLEDALKSIHENVQPHNPKLYAAMARSYTSEIELLRREIDVVLGVSGIGSGYELKLKGGIADSGQFDLHSLTEVLAKLQQTVNEVALSIFTTKNLRDLFPKIDHRDLSRLRVLALNKGSFTITLNVYKPQLELFNREVEELGDISIRTILDGVEELRKGIKKPPEGFSRKALMLTRGIIHSAAKSKSGVVLTRVFDNTRGKGAELDNQVEAAITGILREGHEPGAISITGFLRALDLDNCHFHVKDEYKGRVKCSYDKADFEESVIDSVDCKVIVFGIAKYKEAKPEMIDVLKVSDIQKQSADGLFDPQHPG
jgi:hypothetical protein